MSNNLTNFSFKAQLLHLQRSKLIGIAIKIRYLLYSSTSLQAKKKSNIPIAYEAEVVEHNAPGGKMDQFSIGLGNIILNSYRINFKYKFINKCTIAQLFFFCLRFLKYYDISILIN